MAQAFCGRVLDHTTAFMAATARSVVRDQDTMRKKTYEERCSHCDSRTTAFHFSH